MRATQDILTREPAHDIDLRQLVVAEIEAHGAPPDARVEIAGEPVRLSRRTAQAFAMAVHELATNGLKYGALAHGGHVHASWARSADGRRLVFCWRDTGVRGGAGEIDGGFGSKLVREIVPYMLGGTSELEATEDGVRCVIELPLERAQDHAAPAHGAADGDDG